MSLLVNNSEALAVAGKLDRQQIEEKIGTFPAVEGRVAGALYNTDTEGAMNMLLHSNPAGIVAGLAAVVKVSEAKGAVLIVSCDINEQEYLAAAGTAGLDLIIEKAQLVNKKAHSRDLFCTYEELAGFAERLTGKTPGIFAAVDENVPQELPAKTVILDLIPAEGVKGVIINHRFYEKADLEGKTLGEVNLYGGVIRTVKDSDCAVDLASREVQKLRAKSCGKCTFCREGLYQISEVLSAVTTGRAKMQDLELGVEIGEAMAVSCNCTLGDAAGSPVISLAKAFAGETEAHIRRKECAAGVCLALTQFYIDPALCKGNGACVDVCPEHCIEGGNGYISVIDGFDCTRCGKCLDVCENHAVKKTSGRLPKLPSRPTRIKGMKVSGEDVGEQKQERTVKRKRVFAAAGAAAKQQRPEMESVVIEKKPEVKTMKTLETDIVIVAGGPAGLAAAITAGEKGLKSIIIEKSSATGGAANMGMGPLGIDTKIQRQNFNNISVKEALDMHMQYTHYRVDEDLVQTYFNKSADTIEWLEEMGVEFAGAFRYFKESEATWHIVKPENGVIGPRAAGAMIKAMTERAKELGCEILLETAAVSLITEDGKVCGAKAVDKDGNGLEVKGKAVIVATGGFGNNKEMLREEFGLHLGEDFFPFQIPGITGDGLRMMWEVGAEKYGANIEAIYQIPDNLNWFLLDAVLRQPNLLINQLGDRFMNEGDMGNTTYVGNALALQPGNYGYCIMDEGILKEYKKNGPDIVDIVHPAEAFLAFDGQAALAVEQNYEGYIEAETVEELAEKLGIDAEKLQDTIDEYNEMCESGIDTKFHKPYQYLHPITGKGKYLVGKYYLAAYGTVGGVRINKYCEVLNADHMPIEGLYSAGSDANTIYGDSYNFTLPGNTMGFAINTGRMAGESAADYIADCE